ncbi:hypothetical protein OUZ56_017213 [Daphnia magna]|uniref:Tc1-like transposase DDE domain-containing protein n=1 Tax=Daphnia magna TaxID=35525 RepID=A0ABR0ASF3_9CRUS|nr:hypothetical protein OUZ56_017213 [Daphnia magna]
MFPLPDNEDPHLRELPENQVQYGFFMHDGCPTHNAIIIRDWLAGEASHPHRIKKLWWPAFSPDLNPIKIFGVDGEQDGGC